MHAVASDARGRYSSTRAREAVVAGDLDEVRRVLGRPHALTGVVVHGDERGRTIGVPTANLEPVPELLPPEGRLRRDGRPLRRGRAARSAARAAA